MEIPAGKRIGELTLVRGVTGLQTGGGEGASLWVSHLGGAGGCCGDSTYACGGCSGGDGVKSYSGVVLVVEVLCTAEVLRSETAVAVVP